MGHPDHGGCGRSVRSGHPQDLRWCAVQLPQRTRLPPRSPPLRSSPSSPAARHRRHQRHRPSPPAGPTAPVRGRSPRRTARPVQLLGPTSDHPRRRSSPSSSITSSRKVVRRSKGSTRVTVRSGRPIARTSPGRPAPEPRSTSEAPGASSDVSARQLSTCLSQSLGASRGPISPRSTPAVASNSTYRSTRGSRSDENALRAASGVEGVSRETSVIEPSLGKYHDKPAWLHALRL